MIACSECRFYDDSFGSHCCHANVMRPDPVHGWALETCHNARADDGKCGPNARFYVTRKGTVLRALFCNGAAQ